MFLLYNFVLTALAPLWVPWMWLRTKKRNDPPNWQERFGQYGDKIGPKPKDRKRIWVHAVSVGEVIAAKPFLKALRREIPGVEIVLSVTTSSGHKTAVDTAIGLYDALVYLPIDVARFTLRAVQQVRPDALVIMETELWFNLLWAAKVFDTPCLVVNGRISDKAFGTSKKLGWFYRSLFKMVDQVLCQSDVDKDRFEALGATNVSVLGNTKFDEATQATSSEDWFAELKIDRDKPVVVVGSTRSELEEQWIAEAFTSNPGVTFVHAPRHPETADRIAAAVSKLPNIELGRRSLGRGGNYVILDTFGELAKIYSVADIAVIGGGFDDLGGQNLIQPLAAGKPVLHGVHMQNFRDVAAAAVASGASISCSTSSDLGEKIGELLKDDEKRRAMGELARALCAKHVGASDRYAKAVISATQSVKTK